MPLTHLCATQFAPLAKRPARASSLCQWPILAGVALLPAMAQLLFSFEMNKPAILHHLYYLQREQPHLTLPPDRAPRRYIVYELTPDEEHIVWSECSETVRLICAENGQEVWQLPTGRGCVAAVSVSHDGLYLATAHDSGAVCVWDMRTRKLLREYYDLKRLPSYVGFADHGRLLWAANVRGTDNASLPGDVRVWDWQKNEFVGRFPKRGYLDAARYGLVVTPDQRHLIPLECAYENVPILEVFHLETGRAVCSLTGSKLLGFLRENNAAVVLQPSNTIAVHNYLTGERYFGNRLGATYRFHRISPCDRYLVAGRYYQLWIGELATGATVALVDDSPPRGQLANLLKLWIPQRAPDPQVYRPEDACFTPDSRHIIVSKFRHNGLTIFETQTGIEVGRLFSATRVYGLRITSHGKYLLGRSGMRLHVWDIRPLAHFP